VHVTENGKEVLEVFGPDTLGSSMDLSSSALLSELTMVLHGLALFPPFMALRTGCTLVKHTILKPHRSVSRSSKHIMQAICMGYENQA